MARGNEHMARGNELMEEIRQQHELNRREHELNRLAFAETARVMSRLGDVLERVDRSQRELQDEVRAQTRAIFKLIDRFENGGAGPATA
jgi:hypothetical protein